MERKVPINDTTISKHVSQELAGRGLRAPCRIQVQTRNGEVTLSGTVQFVHQRDTAVQAIRTVEGVKRIVEKLKVTPSPKHQYGQHASSPGKQAAAEEAPATGEEVTPGSEPEALNENGPSPEPLAAAEEQAMSAAGASADVSFTMGEAPRADPHAPSSEIAGLHHTRKGDSYTFECAGREEAERLRGVLANYADWLKKNSWVGQSKAGGERHRVTFHAKSVIDFLRQEGF